MAGEYDKHIVRVSLGEKNLGKSKNVVIGWAQLGKRFKTPVQTRERHSQYRKEGIEEKNRLKGIGGWFLGAHVTDGRRKAMKLTHREFFNRLLQHVPIPYSHTVRYYGLYNAHNIDELNRCRAHMGQAPVDKPELMDWSAYCERIGLTDQVKCPVCGRRIVYAGILKRGKPPPERKRYDTAA